MLVEEPRSGTGDSLETAPSPSRPSPRGPIDSTVIVLAAGLSTRFGRNKLLEPLGNTTLIRHVVSEAVLSRARRVIVVGGYDFDSLQKALEGLPCVLVYNEDYTRGQSFSVRKGMSLVNSEADAVLFEYARTRAPIVSAGHRGRPGHPILFDRSLFDELNEVTEATKGLKKVVSAHRSEARIIETSVGSLFDLDTPFDLSLLKERKTDAELHR